MNQYQLLLYLILDIETPFYQTVGSNTHNSNSKNSENVPLSIIPKKEENQNIGEKSAPSLILKSISVWSFKEMQSLNSTFFADSFMKQINEQIFQN